MDRLLFVDDDPAILRIFRRMFASPSCTVEIANSAEEALPMIAQADFDAIISDFSMTGMNGAEFLERAYALRPSTMRILVTGHTDFGAAVAAVNRGCVFRIVRKPWQDDDLRFLVKLAVETRRGEQERREMSQMLAEKNRALACANSDLRRLNQHLDAMVRERTANLLDALISALDFRDTETLNHSKRVSAYALRLGRELGLSGDELSVVAQGALLHDIGKIGVPDSVLLKPGALTEEEWDLMRRHPALGADLLKPIEFLRDAREIVLQHQEKFDGTGYPARLKGVEICIGARIFAVVDTFDAITSDRPYRKGAPYEKARLEIERVAGTQLDPRVTAAFSNVAESVWASIRDQVESGSSTMKLLADSMCPAEELEAVGLSALPAVVLKAVG